MMMLREHGNGHVVSVGMVLEVTQCEGKGLMDGNINAARV